MVRPQNNKSGFSVDETVRKNPRDELRSRQPEMNRTRRVAESTAGVTISQAITQTRS